MKKVKYIFIILSLIYVNSTNIFALERNIPNIDFNRYKEITNLSQWRFPVTFQYKASTSAHQVYIAGSFNGWNPRGNAMQGPDENGIWKTNLELPEGRIQYKFVVNGEEWFHDTNNPLKVDDGHEGFNSVMEIGKLTGVTIEAKTGDGKIFEKGIDHYPILPDLERIGTHRIKILCKTLKNDVEDVRAFYITETTTFSIHSSLMTKLFSDRQYDHYQTVIEVSSPLLAYWFLFKDKNTFCYLGINSTGSTINQIQAYPVKVNELPYVSVPEWSKKVVWYQIFPERFRNGDTSNDILGSKTPPWISDWYELQPWEKGDFYANVYNRFYGGDIQGILEKLPYLKELGITAIYLNPVFMSPSIHGYDAMDYRHINPHFGYLEDTVTPPGESLEPDTWKFTKTDKLFLEFIDTCHKNGMKVIIDGVFNHTGDQFWAFKDLMKKGKESPYKDWYKVIDFGPPVKYQGWWGSQQLPEIKQDENGLVAGIREHIFDITTRWMDPNNDGDPTDGIDGWRLDVPDLVAGKFWQEWCAHVRKINPEAYIVGELWGRSSDWTRGDKFDAVMNYEFIKRVYRYFIDKDPNKQLTTTEFDRSLYELISWYPYQVNYAMQNLLDSHDTDRIASAIMNPNREFDSRNRLQDPDGQNYKWQKPGEEIYQKLKLILLFQMTFVGAPMIWYGDEVGMWGADDPSDRKPMLWEDLGPYENPENTVNKDLLNHYKQLISLRNQYECLQTGTFETLLTDDNKNIYAFRRKGKDSIVVILNNSNQSQSILLNIRTDKSLFTVSSSKYHGTTRFHMEPHAIITLPPYDGIIVLEK